jgi:hypothetical protein
MSQKAHRPESSPATDETATRGTERRLSLNLGFPRKCPTQAAQGFHWEIATYTWVPGP